MTGVDLEQAEGTLLALLEAAAENGVAVSRVKAAKLLYLCDLEATRQGIEPFSGVTWKWLQHGPFNYGLYTVEDALVEAAAISRDQSTTDYGKEVRLTGNTSGWLQKLPPDQAQIIERIVRCFGALAPSRLRDISYRTAPMLAAQAAGRGVTLDLDTDATKGSLCPSPQDVPEPTRRPRPSPSWSPGFRLPGKIVPRLSEDPKGERLSRQRRTLA